MTRRVPLLPVRNAVLLPAATATYAVRRASSVALVASLAPGDVVGAFTQKDARKVEVGAADVHPLGTLARVTAIEPADGGRYDVTLLGMERVRLDSVVAHEPHLAAKVEVVIDANGTKPETKELARALAKQLEALGAAQAVVLDELDPGRYADRVAATLDLALDEKIAILGELDVPARLRLLANHARCLDRAHTAEVEAVAVASDDAASKKERVLHTRVPAVLERELKRLAESLRVPVSNLVRAVLEDAVAVADAAGEGVETRLKRFAKNLEEERDRLKRRVQREPLADVFAFQPVKLAMPATCAKCEKELKRGVTANLGLTEKPRAGNERIFVCDACLPPD